MIKNIVFIAVLILFIFLCCLLSFLVGLMAVKIKIEKSTKAIVPQLNEKEENKIKKAKREYENFMTYNGDEQ